jgi:hypothetical protein
MEPYSTPPEFEPLPDAQSNQGPSSYERSLIATATGSSLVPSAYTLRALRAGHEAGRRSVLQAPVRVWREGDPPPESKVMLVNGRNVVREWDPETMNGWERYLANFGPLIELPVPVVFDGAIIADSARRRTLREGAL